MENDELQKSDKGLWAGEMWLSSGQMIEQKRTCVGPRCSRSQADGADVPQTVATLPQMLNLHLERWKPMKYRFYQFSLLIDVDKQSNTTNYR